MANKEGKYKAFRDWLIWCHSLSANSAKTTVSFLRQLETKVLILKHGTHGELNRIHEALNDIDSNNSVIPVCEIKEQLKKLNGTITKERGTLNIEFYTLQGFQRAFNLYLKFLVDVTDCFDMAAALEINPKIDIGGPSDKKIDPETPLYKNQLKIFKAGLYKPLLKIPGIKNLLENVLDDISDAVDNLLASNGRLVVPTQFVVGGKSQIRIGDWRSTIIDNIKFDIDLDYNLPPRIPIKIVRRCSYKETAKLLSEILYWSLLIRNELNQYINHDSDVVTDIKDTIDLLKSSEPVMRDTSGLERGVLNLQMLLREYARCFEVKDLNSR